MTQTKNSTYFSHDIDASSDPKIIVLIGEYGAAGYGIWWRIVELLHSSNGNCLEQKEYVFLSIAKQMLTPVEQIKAIIIFCVEVCELFYIEDDKIFSARVYRNITKRQEISEMKSQAGKASAEKRRLTNSTSHQQKSTGVEQNLTNKEINKTNKETKKINKENILLKRKEDFKISLSEFLETYGKDMLNNFFRYWTEPNKSKTKMKWELERTWDIDGRLKYWSSNDKTFASKQKTSEPAQKSDLVFK